MKRANYCKKKKNKIIQRFLKAEKITYGVLNFLSMNKSRSLPVDCAMPSKRLY